MAETKIKFSKAKIIAKDPEYEKLKWSGAKNIHKWRLVNTATSPDSETEMDAPSATFLGDVEEVTTVLFTKTKILTIGTEYLSIPFSAAAGGSAETMHDFYVDKQETTTITCLAKASCVAESSFHFWVDNGAGCETEYYCWMNVSGTDSDPSESGTAIECDISGATTAIEVAEVIDGLIDAKTGVGCDNGGTANLPIINANNGNVTDASQGTTSTGFTISIEQGGDNPNRAGCCTITCSTQAAAVESSSFHFFVADGSGGETEYYIWINKGAGSDPEESGTAIECDISGATTAIEVAEIIDGLIAAKDDVGCDNGGTATLPIINANAGSVTDPYDGTTTATDWSFIFQDGTLDAGAAGTAHSCDISASTTAADVATVFQGIINGVAGITASVSTATVTIESDNSGDITDVAQSGASLGTITVVNQGRAYYEGSCLYIVSTHADDTDAAAKDCRAVIIVGWDHNGDPAVETVRMAGATSVKTSTRWKAVSHMYASEFGTAGQDAKGDITLETSNTANCTELLKIAATYTESNGARIYVPDGANIVISLLRLVNITLGNTGTTIVKLLFSGFEHIKNTDPDNDFILIVATLAETMEIKPISITPRIGTDTAFITLKDSEMGTEGNETFLFEMEFYTFEY